MVGRGVRCFVSLLLACVAGAVQAQSAYPAKPVRLLVGFPAGGSVDILARIFAQRFTQTLGQQVIVDNRAGAGSNIAGELASKAPPDGYTLLVGSAGGLGGNLSIYRRMPYDPFKDLTPIAQMVIQGNILIVNSSVPAKSVRDLLALARARPGQLNAASGGNGSSQHLSMEIFNNLGKVKMVHVPYKGGAPAMADLLGGQVDVMFQTIPEAVPHLKGGKIRSLGVTMAKRAALLPDVPTIAESGLPGFQFEGFMGLVGPAGLPRELVARLNTEVNNALADSAVKSRLLDSGLELAGGTAEHLLGRMRAYSESMIKLAKDAGIQPVD